MKMGCIDYAVLSNGATVMDINSGDVIYSNFMDKEDLSRIIEIMEKYPAVYEVYAVKRAFVTEYSRDNYMKANLPKVFLEDYITRFEVTDDIKQVVLEHDIEKINVNYIEEQYWEDILKDVEQAGDFEFTAGFVGNIEITAKNADKGYALEVLCQKLGIDASEVVAFGDSGNDATMLEWAGRSYAMKNANEKAKKSAKYETELTNGQGGVGDTINKLLNKEERRDKC